MAQELHAWPDHGVFALDPSAREEHARFPVLEWLYRESKGELPHLTENVGCDDPSVIVWLYEYGRRHLNTILHLRRDLDEMKYEVAKQYLGYGERQSLSFEIRNTCNLAEAAITSNRLDQVQWLYEHDPGVFMPIHLNHGISCGHLEVVKWLYKKFPEQFFYDPACSKIVSTLDVDIIRWVLCDFG